MSRPTVLIDPWLSLAIKLGGAGALYALLQDTLGCSLPTAKRICYGTGQLTHSEWCKLDRIFLRHRLPLIV